MQSPYLTIKDYSKENYREIIKQFIGITKLEQGQKRYNVVLDKKQKQYLDWAAARYSRSRSALLRDFIDRNSEADPEYKKFLKL